MSNNTQTQHIISLLPLINNLRNAGQSYPEIAKILQTTNQLNIISKTPGSMINNLVNLNKQNKLNLEFTHYKLFFYESVDEITHLERSVKTEYGFNFTFNNVGILDNRLITSENFHVINNIKGILIAKRLLRLHAMPDTDLIKIFLKNSKNTISQDDYEFIKNIHKFIIPIFNELDAELKSKASLFNDYNWN